MENQIEHNMETGVSRGAYEIVICEPIYLEWIIN